MEVRESYLDLAVATCSLVSLQCADPQLIWIAGHGFEPWIYGL